MLATILQQPLPIPRSNAPIADTSIFRRLDLPAPNRVRTGTGAPGPDYWQQKVDYTIRVSLDPRTHRLTGDETIHYTNNSPDTLRYLWLQLDQNLFRRGSRGSFLFPDDTRFGGGAFEGGMSVSDVAAVRGTTPAGRQRAAAVPGAARRVPLNWVVNGTLVRVDLDQPLPPRTAVDVAMSFAFNVPEHGADRMGRERFGDGWLYEMAQWYPRLCVYDDIRGWNIEQYLGQGEFYLEYGDFDYYLTVPRSFVVAGTGTLVNRAEVLTPEQVQRLDLALRSDTTVPIISNSEVGRPASRPQGASPTLTWHFRANSVRDVAWSAAPNFIWDASGWNDILMQSFYPPAADSIWRRSTEIVRHAIKHYSEKWFPYPYPTAINVNGPVGGMEYPMIVFCRNRTNLEGLFGVTSHELGHEWFPMIVGNNERLYAWQDEGFNTFIGIYSTIAWRRQPLPTGSRGGAEQWAAFARSGYDQPIMLPADRVPSPLLGQAGYNKPATGLYLLRHAILDDSTRFDFAFREYVRRWAFKHPTPADFFRTMEDALGEDLSWFWRGWFFRTDRVDLAVDSVQSRPDSPATSAPGTFTSRVFLSSPGTLPMPVELRLTYTDGSFDRLRLPVEIWYLGNRYILLRRLPKQLMRVEVDPDQVFPDVIRENNTWPRGGGRVAP
ncbi:MAG: M1 family metallopeptidase [Gemmatimonadetes bacterium]|nr:M1 family metallopeptidase [Gemmatimonadota bacterium]